MNKILAYKTSKMSNTSVIISYLTSDMPIEMQQAAVNYATMGLIKYKTNYGDIAEYIKNEFEHKYPKYWCCIVVN